MFILLAYERAALCHCVQYSLEI